MHSNCIMQELDVTNSLLQEINIFVESSHDGILVDVYKRQILRHPAQEGSTFLAKRTAGFAILAQIAGAAN